MLAVPGTTKQISLERYMTEEIQCLIEKPLRKQYGSFNP